VARARRLSRHGIVATTTSHAEMRPRRASESVPSTECTWAFPPGTREASRSAASVLRSARIIRSTFGCFARCSAHTSPHTPQPSWTTSMVYRNPADGGAFADGYVLDRLAAIPVIYLRAPQADWKARRTKT